MMRVLPPSICLLVSLAGLCSCGEKKKPAGRVDLIVEAERVAASKSRTPEDVQPYDESLSWHEYKVKRVISGELAEPVIHVAHWTVLNGKAVPLSTGIGEAMRMKLATFETVEGIKAVPRCDELEIAADEPPRFLDLSQPLPPKAILGEDRADYAGSFSDQMKLYWKLRPQLKLVAMGNSHATKGIATQEFYGAENRRTPVALNLAPPGACLEMECLVIREYVLPLPKLQWVVWVPSARTFNARRKETWKYDDFMGSRGYAWDRAHQEELWPVPASPPVTLEDLGTVESGIVDFWGWGGRRKRLLPEDPAAARQAILKDLEKPDFEISEEHWKLFTDTLRMLTDRGVGVLLVNMPMHPFLKDMPTADPNGTTHEGMAEMVRRLEGLHAEMPRVWFRDFNLGGRHDFPHEVFYDADHLNRSGSRDLTKRIVRWMEEIGKGKP